MPPPMPSTALAVRTAEESSEAPQHAELDLPMFAATVQAIARTCPAGSWGENKVFINHVWRQLEQEANFPPLELAAFKERLIVANQRGLVKLERADPIETMNPDDVRESKTTVLTATYHFIVVERDRHLRASGQNVATSL